MVNGKNISTNQLVTIFYFPFAIHRIQCAAH